MKIIVYLFFIENGVVLIEEIDKLQRAKLYIDKLAKGIDPITEYQIHNESVLNNERLSKCFAYVSEVLQKVINNGGLYINNNHQKVEFFLTGNQKNDLINLDTHMFFSEFIKKVNEITQGNNCGRLKYRRVKEWLSDQGFLLTYTDETNNRRKKVTIKGESIGIRGEMRDSNRGPYQVIFLNSEAQSYIIQNIDNILQNKKSFKLEKAAEYQGTPWSKAHEDILVDLFKKQVPVDEIAVTLKRTETGIRARLKKLGLIENRADAK